MVANCLSSCCVGFGHAAQGVYKFNARPPLPPPSLSPLFPPSCLSPVTKESGKHVRFIPVGAKRKTHFEHYCWRTKLWNTFLASAGEYVRCTPVGEQRKHTFRTLLLEEEIMEHVFG